MSGLLPKTFLSNLGESKSNVGWVDLPNDTKS